MKPLNLRNYLLLSIKQVSPQIVLLAIKIGLFIFLCSIGFAVIYGLNNSSFKVMENFASITIKEDVPESRKTEILEEVKQIDGFEKELKGKAVSEGYGKLIIFNTFCWIIETTSSDMEYVLEQIDGKLINGTYPQQVGEVIITEELSKQLNKGIGDTVGMEELLNKRYKITGIYSGDQNVYLTYINTNDSEYLFKVNPNKMDNFYQELKNYQEDIVITTDRENVTDIINNIFYLLKIIGIFILIITAIEVSISVSNLNKVYFQERLSEFAILQAVGYSKNFVLRRILKELIAIISIGLIIGIVIGETVMTLFYYLFCYDEGIPYKIYEPGLFGLAFILSVIIFLFSYLPVKKYINKMDWIEVIQKNNG